jgi:hypothetical protein
VFRRRFATAGAAATDRIRALRLDYATLLYGRKVYDGWSNGRMSTAADLEGVIIGDTYDGDELVVHPSDPDFVGWSG